MSHRFQPRECRASGLRKRGRRKQLKCRGLAPAAGLAASRPQVPMPSFLRRTATGNPWSALRPLHRSCRPTHFNWSPIGHRLTCRESGFESRAENLNESDSQVEQNWMIFPVTTSGSSRWIQCPARSRQSRLASPQRSRLAATSPGCSKGSCRPVVGRKSPVAGPRAGLRSRAPGMTSNGAGHVIAKKDPQFGTKKERAGRASAHPALSQQR